VLLQIFSGDNFGKFCLELLTDKYSEMQALTTEWPLCDPQYVLNELREVPSFYKTYKIWTKLEEYQKKNVRIKWNELSEDVRKGIASRALQKFENAQNEEKQRQVVRCN
jgi:hypothetical protein